MEQQEEQWFVVTDCEFLTNLIICLLEHYVTEVAKQFTNIVLAS